MSGTYLLLWLESPLQSWGADSKFYRRDTLKFPTKSGVLGLICCALGAGGEQRELLSRLTHLKQTVLSFVRSSANDEHIKKPPLLRDFHMIGSGYDGKSLSSPKTNQGKEPVGGGARISYRYYLQDATFAIVMQVQEDLVDHLSNALKNPVWDLYLGRKNCVPTDFIYRGVFKTEKEAIEHSLHIAREKSLIEEFRVLEGEHQGEIFLLNDVPIQFGENKLYQYRTVTKVLS